MQDKKATYKLIIAMVIFGPMLDFWKKHVFSREE